MSVDTLASDVPRPMARDQAPDARALLRSPVAVAIAGLTVLAAILRFTRLGHQGFWFDEADTALLVHLSPGKMLGLLPRTDATPPLYYCLAWAWVRIFGYGEAGLRSLSALAGVATVPLVYAATAKLISSRAGLIAAALTACNPYLIWYSQEARAYSLLVLLTATTLLAFAYAMATPTPQLLLSWIVACGLALATHYYALLAIVPEAVGLLAVHWRKRSVQVALGITALCGLALIPLAISQRGTGGTSWIARLQLAGRLKQIFPEFLTGYQAPAQRVMYPIAAATVLLALVLLAVRSDPIERRVTLAAGGLAIGGLMLNLVLVAGGVDDLITRNLIALWIPAAVLVAGGLGARRAGMLGLTGAATLCTIGIVASVGVAVDRSLQRPDWRGVARVLGPRPAPATTPRAILVQRYPTLLPLSLYMPQLKFWPGGDRAIAVSELDVVAISAPRVHLCWWGGACNLTSSRMQSSYAVPGFHELWRRRAYQFTIMRLVSTTPVAITPREISRVLTATRLKRDELLVQRPPP